MNLEPGKFYKTRGGDKARVYAVDGGGGMSFDIEPDAPLHGECAAEIKRLEAENAKLRAVVEAVKKLRVITPEEAVDGKPFWVIPCDSYEPLRIAMDELEGLNE